MLKGEGSSLASRRRAYRDVTIYMQNPPMLEQATRPASPAAHRVCRGQQEVLITDRSSEA